MDAAIPIIFVLVGVLIVAGIIYGVLQAKKRREDLAKLAAEMGLTYAQNDPFNLPSSYSNLGVFQQGHSKQAYNVLHGQRGNYPVKAFDYVYYTTETSTDSKGVTTTREVSHYLSAIIYDTDVVFPTLTVRPEGFFDKVAAAIGFDDIDFESAEFSRKFFVKSSDRKFAFAVIHARMMEYLLKNEGWTLELIGPVVLLQKGGFFGVPDFANGMTFVDGFLAQFPNYLWDNLRGKP